MARKMENVLDTYLGGVQNGVAAAVAAATSATATATGTAIGAEPDDIPKTSSPVWILGRQYCAIQGER